MSEYPLQGMEIQYYVSLLFPYLFFHFSGLESRGKTRANTGDSNMTELGYEPPPKKPVKRQYFVLTHAGKPVFTDRTEEEADSGSEEVTNLIGVMHALISVFEDDQDKIRCVQTTVHCFDTGGAYPGLSGRSLLPPFE